MCACPSEIAKGDRNCGGLLHNDGRKVKMVWSWDGACVLTHLKEISKFERVPRKTHFEPRRLTQPVAQQCLNVIVKPP